MVRFAIALVIMGVAAATLGSLQAEEWPLSLFYLAMMPFLLVAGLVINPALQRYSRRRRSRRAAH